ncbi:MAG: hypothetical protein AAF483_11940 [Planctomycetota bacterium]
MLVRNIEIENASVDEVAGWISNSLRCRGGNIHQQDAATWEFTGLQGTSSLLTGVGEILVIPKGGKVAVRIGMNTYLGLLGIVFCIMSLVLAIPTIGVLFFIFWLIREQAAAALAAELSVIANELNAKTADTISIDKQ